VSKRSRRNLAGAALASSVALHAAVAGWLATRDAARREPRREPEIIEFEVGPVASAPVAPTPVEPERTLEPSPPTQPSSRRRARASVASSAPSSSATVVTIPPIEPSTPTAPSLTPSASTPSSVTVRPTPRDLSPLAAALTMRESFGTAQRCGEPSAADSTCAPAADAGAAPSAHSEQDAVIALRKELKLKPHSDGSYTYEGASLEATISPDGRVDFRDKSMRDLTTFVERHIVGMQVNTVEKRRFMERTAALREKLAEVAEAQNQRRARDTLRATLFRVWRDPALSLAQKRSTLFGLWDECASDASGNAAQAAIESFVREHLPADSALAYSSSELATLNRRRASRRVFDPYAPPDAGTQPG
jgi:hypothetical protein